MEIVFLGHQSWLVQSGNNKILVDPVLKDTIGNNSEHVVQVYPPRTINLAYLSDIDAIILSHEHSDHFDLISLDCLPRVPVYLGTLVVNPIEAALKKMGFPVYRVHNTSRIQLGRLSFRLYPSHPETAFWESRVYQIYFEENQSKIKFLIGVDALISDTLLNDISKAIISDPTIIAISNNSQIVPAGAIGPLQNIALNEEYDKEKHGLIGISVIKCLLEYIECLPSPEHILICGGGFMTNSFGPFPFSDQDKIAFIMDQLENKQTISGLLPGQCLFCDDEKSFIKSVDWINLDKNRLDKLVKHREEFIEKKPKKTPEKTTKNHLNKEENVYILKEVESELNKLSKHILLSPLGKHLITNRNQNNKAFKDIRLVIIFTNVCAHKNLVYGLNIHTAKFQNLDIDTNEATNGYPYGIIMSLKNFHSVISGKIQIWDIAGSGMHGWYKCPAFESPVSFMYSFYGENTSPELLNSIINYKLSDIGY